MLLEHHPFVVLAVFLLLAAGGWLLLVARSRNDDRSPHCGICGYNLTGRASDRCPECGTPLNDDTLSEGPPSRMRWGHFLAGAILLASAISTVVWLAFG